MLAPAARLLDWPRHQEASLRVQVRQLEGALGMGIWTPILTRRRRHVSHVRCTAALLHHLVDLAGVEAGGLEVGQSVAHAVAVVEAVAAPGLVRVPEEQQGELNML